MKTNRSYIEILFFLVGVYDYLQLTGQLEVIYDDIFFLHVSTVTVK